MELYKTKLIYKRYFGKHSLNGWNYEGFKNYIFFKFIEIHVPMKILFQNKNDANKWIAGD
jgi:hypothetical protein